MEHFRRTMRADCARILADFQASSSVRFEEFSRLWRAVHGSAIFYGRMDPNERRVFTRMALSTAAPYFFPPYTFQIRVGGLYLLYSLYNTQLMNPKEKIHLALKDLEDVRRFQQDAVEAQHYDVAYILRCLLSEKAFYFTAMPKPLVYREKRMQEEWMRQPIKAFVDPSSRPQELISTDMLEELANVHEHYEGLKQAIATQTGQQKSSLIRPNLVPKLRNAVVTYHNWQRNQNDIDSQTTVSDSRDPGEGTSDQDESSRRAQLLASIKSKSYGQAMEVSRSRRHRQVDLTSADAETKTTQKDASFRRRTMSLKVRTQLDLMEKVKQKEELMNVTRLWRLTTVEDEKTEEKKKRRFNWNSECK